MLPPEEIHFAGLGRTEDSRRLRGLDLTCSVRQEHLAQAQQVAVFERAGAIGRKTLVVKISEIDAVEVFDPVLIVFARDARMTARDAGRFRAEGCEVEIGRDTAQRIRSP